MKDLKVILKESYDESGPNAGRKKMCEAMKEIRGLRNFELVIQATDRGNWGFAVDAPFEVIRGISLVADEIGHPSGVIEM